MLVFEHHTASTIPFQRPFSSVLWGFPQSHVQQHSVLGSHWASIHSLRQQAGPPHEASQQPPVKSASVLHHLAASRAVRRVKLVFSVHLSALLDGTLL